MKEAKDFDPFRLFLTLYYWNHVMQRRYSDCAKFWDDQKQGSHADEGPSLNFTRFQSSNKFSRSTTIQGKILRNDYESEELFLQ